MLAIAAASAYVVTTLVCVRRMRTDDGQLNPTLAALALISVLLHGLSLISEVAVSGGFALGLGQAVSLMLLTMCIFLVAVLLFLPVASLLACVTPVAAVWLLAKMAMTTSDTAPSNFSPLLITHIVLSIAAVSVLMLAFIHALLLSRLESGLRQHTLTWARLLPPLESMERLLFAAIWTGLIGLVLAIGTGFLYLEDLFGQRGMVHHTVLLSAAAVAYAILLIGHYFFGWRGSTAVRWVIGATILLLLGYFGSKFVIEVLLA